MNNPALRATLGVLARWALQGLGAWLIARHILTPDQAATFSSVLVDELVTYAPSTVALAWSLAQKYRARLREIALHELPPGAQEDQIRLRMRTITLRDVLTA